MSVSPLRMSVSFCSQEVGLSSQDDSLCFLSGCLSPPRMSVSPLRMFSLLSVCRSLSALGIPVVVDVSLCIPSGCLSLYLLRMFVSVSPQDVCLYPLRMSLSAALRTEFSAYARDTLEQLTRSIAQTTTSLESSAWLAGPRLLHDTVEERRKARGAATKPFLQWLGLDQRVRRLTAGEGSKGPERGHGGAGRSTARRTGCVILVCTRYF